MTDYRYQVQGRGAKDEAWFTSGKVTANGGGAFMPAIQETMRRSFVDLTQGKATYGSPGLGCAGPYRITSLTVSEVREKEGTWFNRHERFGDCEPNEVYIGMGVFASFRDKGQLIDLRNADGKTILIDQGSVSILAGALMEWKEKTP
jgi:hypothetical protein